MSSEAELGKKKRGPFFWQIPNFYVLDLPNESCYTYFAWKIHWNKVWSLNWPNFPKKAIRICFHPLVLNSLEPC
uniref:Uncharacterized protein n=1 Tax=Arundo donax TaxID=35708 RepID=A0A0A8YN64_ARUDO